MIRVFALVAPDGHVAILKLQPGHDRDKAIKDFGAVSFVPVSVTEIAEADIPTDKTYRDAWTFDGKSFGHNFAKAQEIHRGQVRAAERRAALKAERSKPIDATAEKKIADAKSIDDLKKIIP